MQNRRAIFCNGREEDTQLKAFEMVQLARFLIFRPYSSKNVRNMASYSRGRTANVHNVIEGDSCTALAYKSLFHKASTKANILITDPPYCILERKRVYGDNRGSGNKRSSRLEQSDEVPKFASLASYRDFTSRWISQSLREGLETNSLLIIWTNNLGKAVITDVCFSLNYELIGEYVWMKTTKTPTQQPSLRQLHPSFARCHPISTQESEVKLRMYESALILAPRAPTTTQCHAEFVSIRGRPWVPRDSLPWAVATSYHDEPSQVSNSAESGAAMTNISAHPCHKPLSALLPLLHTWTLPNDTILDPFAGSGGILLALLAMNASSPPTSSSSTEVRKYRGIEMLPRWVSHCNQLAAGQCLPS